MYVTRYQKRQLQVISNVKKLPCRAAGEAHDSLARQVSTLDAFSRRGGGDKQEVETVLGNVLEVMMSQATTACEKQLVAKAVGLAPCLLRILRTLRMEEREALSQATGAWSVCLKKVYMYYRYERIAVNFSNERPTARNPLQLQPALRPTARSLPFPASFAFFVSASTALSLPSRS